MDFKLWSVLILSILNYHNSLALHIDGRISDGTPATDSHSFAVRVISVVNDVTPEGSLSSGVAVTQRHIVTVAQAIFGFNMWYIGYGSIHVDEQLETISLDAAVPATYNPIFLHDNVGVIRVNDTKNWLAISFTDSLPLATVGYGYGGINEENILATTLKRAVFNSQSIQSCIQYFNSVVVRDDNLCATSLSQIRNGDQGGPVTDPLVTHIIGIITFWGSTVDSSIAIVNLRQHQLFLEFQLAL